MVKRRSGPVIVELRVEVDILLRVKSERRRLKFRRGRRVDLVDACSVEENDAIGSAAGSVARIDDLHLMYGICRDALGFTVIGPSAEIRPGGLDHPGGAVGTDTHQL